MLEYDRIDISEGIAINKTNASKECDICHYWYFKDIGFKYESYLFNGCHDLMQKAIRFNNVAVAYVKGRAYRIHFWYMSKDDAFSLMNNSNLIDKKAFYNFSLLYVKNERKNLLSKKQRCDTNTAKEYYENNKERLREKARDKYRNLSEEEKNKKREYGKNRYHNMPEEKKQRLKEYQKNYREAKKSQYNNQ